MAERVYHWKHGWIPLTPEAAVIKAHGSKVGAQKLLVDKEVAAVAAGEKTVEEGKRSLGTLVWKPSKPGRFDVHDPESGKKLGTVVKTKPNQYYVFDLQDRRISEAVDREEANLYLRPGADSRGRLRGQAALEATGIGNSAALAEYRKSGYRTVNKGLRKYKGDASKIRDPHTRQLVEDLRKDFADAHPVSADIAVFRGIKYAGLPKESMKGMEFVDHGFVSTSPSAGQSQMWGRMAVMRITVPKGTKAVAMGHKISDPETEILLGDGTKFRILSDEILDGKRTIEAEVI